MQTATYRTRVGSLVILIGLLPSAIGPSAHADGFDVAWAKDGATKGFLYLNYESKLDIPGRVIGFQFAAAGAASPIMAGGVPAWFVPPNHAVPAGAIIPEGDVRSDFPKVMQPAFSAKVFNAAWTLPPAAGATFAPRDAAIAAITTQVKNDFKLAWMSVEPVFGPGVAAAPFTPNVGAVARGDFTWVVAGGSFALQPTLGGAAVRNPVWLVDVGGNSLILRGLAISVIAPGTRNLEPRGIGYVWSNTLAAPAPGPPFALPAVSAAVAHSISHESGHLLGVKAPVPGAAVWCAGGPPNTCPDVGGGPVGTSDPDGHSLCCAGAPPPYPPAGCINPVNIMLCGPLLNPARLRAGGATNTWLGYDLLTIVWNVGPNHWVIRQVFVLANILLDRTESPGPVQYDVRLRELISLLCAIETVDNDYYTDSVRDAAIDELTNLIGSPGPFLPEDMPATETAALSLIDEFVSGGIEPDDIDGPPEAFQSCCLNDGSCILADPVCCTSLRGTPQGVGSTCAATVCEPPDCPWDLNNDGSVNATDLATLLGAWGSPYGATELADLIGAWGPCP